MLRRTRWGGLAILVAASGVGVWNLAEGAESQRATKVKRPSAAEIKEQSEGALREAIGQETVGDVSERDSTLDDLIGRNPDFAPARWQRGYIKTSDGWQHIDELASPNSTSSLQITYSTVRDKTPDDVAGNLALATWCKKHGLKEAARGHWNRAIALDPNCQEAHVALGDTRVDGTWLTQDEVAEANGRTEATRNALRTLGRKIPEWAQGYATGPDAKKKFCEEKLRQVRDPAAIPLLLRALAPRGDESALLLVDMLKSMPSLEATYALSDLGVRTDSAAVRRVIVEELKLRDEHAVMPPLLLAMSSPVTSKMQLTVSNEGALVYRHVFARENQRQKEVRVQNTNFVTSGSGDGNDDPSSGAIGAIAAASMFAARNEAEVARQNLTIQQVNDRISLLLSQITDSNNGKPEDWWNWWNKRQQIQIQGDKPTQTSIGTQTLAIQTGGGQQRSECFVKGTPVWTSRGKVAIETIRPGDLVLSQDVKTGELAFKAVVQPTQRAAEAIYQLEIGCAKLECTGGHSFWVTGTGWTKASDLRPGMLVRCADGAKPVLTTAKGREVETHNLIVADFHSYFVGEEKTLCHDNTDQRPTLAIAPGVYRDGEAPSSVRK
jgi:hypothetical protein